MSNLQVLLDDHEASALANCGADYFVLSESILWSSRNGLAVYDELSGDILLFLGQCRRRVDIAEHRSTVKFVALPMCARNVIIGMDNLFENRGVIDLYDGTASLWS